jgi:hypothetical protein
MDTYPTSPVPTYSYTKQIGYKTLVSAFENGVEQRRNKWGQGKLTFTLTYAYLSTSDVTTLYNFYVSEKGSFTTFLFNDLSSTSAYTVRFVDDNLSLEQFAKNVSRTGLKMIQVL